MTVHYNIPALKQALDWWENMPENDQHWFGDVPPFMMEDISRMVFYAGEFLKKYEAEKST